MYKMTYHFSSKKTNLNAFSFLFAAINFQLTIEKLFDSMGIHILNHLFRLKSNALEMEGLLLNTYLYIKSFHA